jgi:transcriptional regulator with XRE-family HTH domain
MALTTARTERTKQDRISPTEVGRNLREVRKEQGLSRGDAARSAGLTRRELAAYERGKLEVPESDLWCLAGSCGVDVSELLAHREPLRVSPDRSTISIGGTVRRLRGPAEPDGVLREYLAMLYEQRDLPRGSPVPLRQPDLAALADALGGTPDTIKRRLVELIGASPEAVRLRATIRTPRSRASAPPGHPRMDPYAALAEPEAPPPVEEFFANPPPDDVFAHPSPGATASGVGADRASDPPAGARTPEHDPFVVPPEGSFAPRPVDPTPGPGPSNLFAGPVDPTGTSPSTFSDPLEPPLDGLLGLAFPEPEARFGISPGGNGHHDLVDDPLAPHWAPEPGEPDLHPEPDSRRISVTDAIGVDDPLAPGPWSDGFLAPPDPAAAVATPTDSPDGLAPSRQPDPSLPRVIPGVARIAWNATRDPTVRVDTDAVPPVAETTPPFDRASPHWQVGGIFPATAMAEDGTLALRRADARWALTDLYASGDYTIDTAFDFRAGSGFGVLFCGSVDDGERITGYSFDIDAIAGGGGYLLRLWEDGRQHWRPLPAQLYGHHVVRLGVQGDELTVVVDGDTALVVPELSRSTVELGRRTCGGDRVGVHAWSTTEVTVQSFRVAGR